MNKYLKLYYFDTFFVLLILFSIYICGYDQIDLFFLFSSGNYYPAIYIFSFISLLSLIFNIFAHINKKFTFIEENLLFPKYYLMFIIWIVILGLIINRLVIIEGLHFMYYLSFVIIGYATLSIYTSLSFKKDKKKNK